MGGQKKKGRAATKANTVGQNSSTAPAQHPCLAVLPVLRDMAGKEMCWTDGLLVEQLFVRVAVVLDWVQCMKKEEAQGGQAILYTAVTAPLVLVSAELVQLLLKLLLARKRPEDWQQEVYSSVVCSTLFAASVVSRVHAKRTGQGPGESPLLQLPGALGRVSRSALLHQTAAAQEEVCQLLQAALKERQDAAQGTSQHHLLLCEIAMHPLRWWTTIDGLWAEAGNDTAFNQPAPVLQQALVRQRPAVELAALLTHTPSADSAPEAIQPIAEVASR